MKIITDTAEWEQLKELARLATNAIWSEDERLECHYKSEIKRISYIILEAYGRDPIVLETLADFSPVVSEAKNLYAEVIQLLDARGDDSAPPRISLAQLILDNGGDVREISGLIDEIDERRLSSDEKEQLIDIKTETAVRSKN